MCTAAGASFNFHESIIQVLSLDHLQQLSYFGLSLFIVNQIVDLQFYHGPFQLDPKGTQKHPFNKIFVCKYVFRVLKK